MRRTSLSLSGGIATVLLLASVPTAQAAVSAKDVPSRSDVVAAFPELNGGEFTTEKSKQIGVPGATCGEAATDKAKSAISTTATSAAGFPLVVVGAAEVKSDIKAKAHLAAFKKYVKKCATFTEPTTGATVTSSLGKNFKLGDDSLAVVQETVVMGITSYSTSVLVRDGKRISSVVAIDDAAIATSSIKKLAKVAAKKLK